MPSMHSKTIHNFPHPLAQTQCIYGDDIQSDTAIGGQRHETQRLQRKGKVTIPQENPIFCNSGALGTQYHIESQQLHHVVNAWKVA